MAAIKQISRVPICLSGIRSVFKRSMNCESDILESRFWMNLLEFRISVCDGFGSSIAVSISFVSISFVSISFSSTIFGASGINVSKSFAKRLSFLGISTVTSADVTIVDASPPWSVPIWRLFLLRSDLGHFIEQSSVFRSHTLIRHRKWTNEMWEWKDLKYSMKYQIRPSNTRIIN